MYALLPLYLVRAEDAPPLHTCRLRNGSTAMARHQPGAAARGQVPPDCDPQRATREHSPVSFRVPHIAPGRYVYVLYCDPCWRGTRGSLIAFKYAAAPVLTVVK